MDYFSREYIFQPLVFRGYVKLREGMFSTKHVCVSNQIPQTWWLDMTTLKHVVLNFEIDISSRFNVVVYQEFAYVFFLYFGEIIQFVIFLKGWNHQLVVQIVQCHVAPVFLVQFLRWLKTFAQSPGAFFWSFWKDSDLEW